MPCLVHAPTRRRVSIAKVNAKPGAVRISSEFSNLGRHGASHCVTRPSTSSTTAKYLELARYVRTTSAAAFCAVPPWYAPCASQEPRSESREQPQARYCNGIPNCDQAYHITIWDWPRSVPRARMCSIWSKMNKARRTKGSVPLLKRELLLACPQRWTTKSLQLVARLASTCWTMGALLQLAGKRSVAPLCLVPPSTNGTPPPLVTCLVQTNVARTPSLALAPSPSPSHPQLLLPLTFLLGPSGASKTGRASFLQPWGPRDWLSDP